MKRLRLRNVFVTQLCESVIGTDEEVVTGYAAFSVEWRTMADYGNSKTRSGMMAIWLKDAVLPVSVGSDFR